MKEADRCGRDESAVKSEGAASVQSKSLAAKRPQNPLIPPAGGCSDAPGWWRLVAGDTKAQGFSVVGDSNSLSVKLTAMLIPALLIVLILVLLKDYSARADFANSRGPVAAGFVAQTPVADERGGLNQEPAESVAAAIVQISEARVETETKAESSVEVEKDPVTPDTGGSEAETMANTGCDGMPEKDAAPETKTQPEPVTVKGILYSRDNPSAIIGDRIVHVGDMVLDATVVGITKDRVVFEKPGQRWGRRVQEAVATHWDSLNLTGGHPE